MNPFDFVNTLDCGDYADRWSGVWRGLLYLMRGSDNGSVARRWLRHDAREWIIFFLS